MQFHIVIPFSVSAITETMMTSNCAFGAYCVLQLHLHDNVGQCYLCSLNCRIYLRLTSKLSRFITRVFLYVQPTRSSKFFPLSHSSSRIAEVLDSLIHNIRNHQIQEISASIWWVALASWKLFWIRPSHGLLPIRGSIGFFWSIHWMCWSVGTRSIALEMMAYTSQ